MRMLLAWYAFAKPAPLTGLPDEEDTGTVFREVFDELGGFERRRVPVRGRRDDGRCGLTKDSDHSKH
jgi:hypothetical protein